jgi:hypothetical protein
MGSGRGRVAPDDQIKLLFPRRSDEERAVAEMAATLPVSGVKRYQRMRYWEPAIHGR